MLTHEKKEMVACASHFQHKGGDLMSVADLKKYGKMAAEDPKVRAEAKKIGLQNMAGQSAYAKTLGLTFDASDMAALAKEVQPSGELSEKELASVAGGVVTTTVAAVAGVVSAAAGVVGAGAAVTSSTTGSGW
jgi:lactobin A/cerein 7B family class IIb bacteriocin